MSIPGYDAWKLRAPGDGPYDRVDEPQEEEIEPDEDDWLVALEDDKAFEGFIESVRAERVSKGLDPDTGLPVQPTGDV